MIVILICILTALGGITWDLYSPNLIYLQSEDEIVTTIESIFYKKYNVEYEYLGWNNDKINPIYYFRTTDERKINFEGKYKIEYPDSPLGGKLIYERKLYFYDNFNEKINEYYKNYLKTEKKDSIEYTTKNNEAVILEIEEIIKERREIYKDYGIKENEILKTIEINILYNGIKYPMEFLSSNPNIISDDIYRKINGSFYQ